MKLPNAFKMQGKIGSHMLNSFIVPSAVTDYATFTKGKKTHICALVSFKVNNCIVKYLLSSIMHILFLGPAKSVSLTATSKSPSSSSSSCSRISIVAWRCTMLLST